MRDQVASSEATFLMHVKVKSNAMKIDLDKKLLEFSGKTGSTDWTIRNAVEGVQIFGGIGSGKTSGSGRLLALKYLSNGFGGLVLTVKEDEAKTWKEYCALTGRTGDLVVIEPGGKEYFNFLEYESIVRTGRSTENIVQVLKTVIRASEEKTGSDNDDPFWETALDMQMFHIIDLCLLAYGKVSVKLLYEIALSVPRSNDTAKSREADTAFNNAYKAAKTNIMAKIDAWEKKISNSEKADKDFASKKWERINNEIPESRVLEFVDQYFMETLRNLSEKTRSIIEFSFTGFLFRLLQEPVYSLFCSKASTVVPEDCLKGKIILINLPVKIFNKTGRDVQILYKYVWQRAMERRRVDENGRPIFLWSDEAQNFIHEYDADYQATARSSRIATVYISQNIPNYHGNMGGDKSTYKVKSFLGTLATKIFHANADIDTNRYASELIGEAYQKVESESRASTDGKVTVTRTICSELAQIVRPEAFVSLRTGGPLNQYKVSAYIHTQGKQFAEGFNHKKISFNQKQAI